MRSSIAFHHACFQAHAWANHERRLLAKALNCHKSKSQRQLLVELTIGLHSGSFRVNETAINKRLERLAGERLCSCGGRRAQQCSVASLCMTHSTCHRRVFIALLFLIFSHSISAQTSPRAESFYRSGITKRASGDLDGAIADYTKAIEISPQYAAAYVNRGVARKTKGDLDGAIADYDKALSMNPRLKEAYNNRGLVLQLKGLLDEAIADFDQALAMDPHYAGAHYNRASAARAKGDLKTAIVELTRAIESTDNDHLSETYNNRGTVRKEAGDIVGSIGDFDRAIEIDAKNIFAHVNRGYALTLLGKDREAQREFHQVLKLNPSLRPEVDATIKRAKEERGSKQPDK